MKKLLLFLFGVLAFAGMRAQGSESWTEESLAQFDADLIANYTDVVYMKSCIFPKGSGVVELPVCIKSHKPFTTTDFNILLPEDLEPEYTIDSEMGDKRGTVVKTDRSSVGTIDFSYVDKTSKWNFLAFSFDFFPDAENNEFCSIKVDISDLDAGVYDLIVLEDQLIAGFNNAPNDYTQHAEQIVTKLVISNEVILDEESEVYPGDYTDVNVKVLRTISAGNWNTLCLPFSMSEEQCKAVFGEDVELAEYAGYDVDDENNTTLINVKFNDITSINANRPLIIKVSKAIAHDDGFIVEGVDILPAADPNDLYVEAGDGWMFGTYTNGTELYHETKKGSRITIDWQYIFLSGNKFYYATKETQLMLGFRAYFDFSHELADKGANISDVKFTFNVNNEPTSIDGISSVEKVAEGVYNLSGQKLSEESLKTLPKGVYIVNGKKVYKK